MRAHEQYRRTVALLRHRYAREDGWVVTWKGLTPTRYTVLEALAAERYLGIRDQRVLGA